MASAVGFPDGRHAQVGHAGAGGELGACGVLSLSVWYWRLRDFLSGDCFLEARTSTGVGNGRGLGGMRKRVKV